MYSSISQIPLLIRDRRYIPAIDDLHAVFLEQMSLSQKQYVTVRDMEDSVLLGSVLLVDIPLHLRDSGIPETLIDDITRLLVSHYFILFQDFLGDMGTMMTSLGINKEDVVTYIHEVLVPHKVLSSFIIDYFPEASLIGLPKETIYTCIDTLLDLVNQQATSSMVQMHMETALAGQLSGEERMYVIKTIQDDIQAGELVPQWAWYYKTLADNVLNTSVALYDQPLLPIVREIDKQEVLSTQVKEYWYLCKFSHLNIEAQKRIVSPEWKQAIKEYEEQSGYIIYPLIISYAFEEYTLEKIVSILKQKYSLGVEDASMVQKKIIELMSGISTSMLTPLFSVSSPVSTVVPETTTNAAVETPAVNTEVKDTNEGKLPMMEESKKPVIPAIDYDAIVERIIKDTALIIEDPAVLTKVRAILLTRLRGIRDGIDTRESLREFFTKLGSKIDPQMSVVVSKEANKYADAIAAGNVPEFAIVKPPVVVEEPKPLTDNPALTQPATVTATMLENQSTTQPIPQKISSPISGRSRTQNHPQFGVSGRTQPIAGKTSAPEPSKTRFAIEEVEGVPMIVEKSVSAMMKPQGIPVATKPMSAPQRPIPTNTGSVPANLPLAPTIQNQTRPIAIRQGGTPSPHKVNLTDVKMAAPRLMDPVDELRAFTIKDFRRLSVDPLAAIRNVYQKIKLLEKDSASRKVAGINAWKANEVSALYTAIGQESFGAGKRIQDIIATRTQQGRPTLTEPEFDALMELNEMMRF